ncbi:MAG: hypothetical protein OXL97_06495 [Chloroflexota bacterium]|nr:hypothetical protein [Chloroflexota bacterium]
MRDRLIRNMEHCDFMYAEAGYTADDDDDERAAFFGGGSGYDSTRRLRRSESGGWRPGGGSSGSFGATASDEDRIDPLDAAGFDAEVWLQSEHDAFISDGLEGEFAGETTYLRQRAARYELRFIEEDSSGPGETASFIRVTDYVVENPFLFLQSTYRISGDGERRLVQQEGRGRFDLIDCVSGDDLDAGYAALREELVRNTEREYNSLDERISSGCFGGYQLERRRLYGHERITTYEMSLDDQNHWRTRTTDVTRRQGEITEGLIAEPRKFYRFDQGSGEWQEIIEEEYLRSRSLPESFDNPQDFIGRYSLSVMPFADFHRSRRSGTYPVDLDEAAYVGSSEIGGAPAVRYEGIAIDASYQGISFDLVVVDYLRDNPMLYRIRFYDLPAESSDPELRREDTLTEIRVEDCSAQVAPPAPPTPFPDVVSDPTGRTAVLHVRAAAVRDRLVEETSGADSCRFESLYGAWHVAGRPSGWSMTRRTSFRDGLATYGSAWGEIPLGMLEEERVPEGEPGSISLTPFEWFDDEYQRFIGANPRGRYVGQSSYLGQPSLRYEERTDYDSPAADAAVTRLTVLDYVAENPYVYLKSDYDLFADGTRKLVRQFTRYSFAALGCAEGERQAWEGLQQGAVVQYLDIQGRVADGCDLYLAQETLSWEHFGLPRELRESADGPLKLVVRSTVQPGTGDTWVLHTTGVYTLGTMLLAKLEFDEDGYRVFDPMSGEWTTHPAELEPYASPLHALGSGATSVVLLRPRFDAPNYSWLRDYYFVGDAEVDGRPVVRYERLELDQRDYWLDGETEEKAEGLELVMDVVEVFKDKPLNYRETSHRLLPNGEREVYTIESVEFGTENCPG